MNNVKPNAETVSIDQLLDERNEYMRLYDELGNQDFKDMADQIILSLKKGEITYVSN